MGEELKENGEEKLDPSRMCNFSRTLATKVNH